MKIISWNCNCKFREKYKEIKKYDADIYVIQECENPQTILDEEYKKFANNYIWIGDNENKGLGIFAKEYINIEKNDWENYCLRYFCSVKVNNSFDLIAIWACSPYIEEYYIYQNINIPNYNLNTVIIGDFNSNKKWDKEHGKRNHSAVVKELNELGLESAYHYISKEAQGKESKNTFYLYRHKDKGYHIDYCFCNPSKIVNYKILDDKNFAQYSDHRPILLDIK